MYRILAEQGETRERRDQLVHPPYSRPELLAERPNQLWSWDITKLLGPAKWTYSYLRCHDVVLGTGAHVRCSSKGRKERHAAHGHDRWCAESVARGAAARCTSLAAKKVSSHVLRHSTAMRLLHAGVDTSVIALWLGHKSIETTQMYVHADLNLKERALARTAPVGGTPGRYRPPDQLLAFLETL
jgi:hypothetical protein